MKHSVHLFPLTAVLLLASVACGRGATTMGAAGQPVTPETLYPLVAGSAWSYDVDADADDTTLAVTKVEERSGAVASIRTGTGPLVKYEIRPNGIVRLQDGAWLLRAPIREGTSWIGRGGRRVAISSIGRIEETPAGTFADCVEVVEDGGTTGVDVRTVYCPGVGPVFVRSAMRSTVRDKVVAVEARLRGYRVGAEPKILDQE